jgi:hypothetical protein
LTGARLKRHEKYETDFRNGSFPFWKSFLSRRFYLYSLAADYG